MEKSFDTLLDKIKEAKTIVVFSHVNPDGDTLGSNLAISLAIEKFFNKKVDSVFVGMLPSIYSYLPGFERFKDVRKISPDKTYDLAISVDVAAKDRLVSGTDLFDNAKYRVNIDHHITNIGYGDLNIIDGNESCVGSLLYKIFKYWGLQLPIEVARCIYASLLTDTGGFKYENTTPESFELAAELVKLGVSPTYEYRVCYETKPQSMIQFQAHVISNAVFYENGKIAIAKITRSDMSKFEASDDFTEGIVETLRTSKSVEVAAILRETLEGYSKVSLRSKVIDVIPIALEFGGGGHTYAAGCTIKKPIAIAFDKLLTRIKNEINKK